MRRTLVVLTLLLAACGGSDGDDPQPGGEATTTYETPADMAETISCEDFSADELADPQPGEGTGRCRYQDMSVILNVFADEDGMAAYEDEGVTFGCAFADDLGYDALYFAAGDLWAATADDNSDKAFTDRLAADLGGETRTLDCT